MELYCKCSCFCSIRYLLLIGIHVFISNAKLYSEDDVYTTNSSTNYSNIPSDCNLFGSKFEENEPNHQLILNITEIGTYWVGAKIGFKRNINPLGVQKECNNTYNGSLDQCNSFCKGRKYLSYNEQSCGCSNNPRGKKGFSKPEICDNPDNGICFKEECVVYERDVLNKDYSCGVYKHDNFSNLWLLATKNCSTKLNFFCVGDESSFVNITSSWLIAEHLCSSRGHNLLQIGETPDDKLKDGRQYWVSFFRRKKISWGKDLAKTVCVAARFQTNGSYRLETHFCNESLRALCHRTEHINYGSSKSEIMTASLGTVLGGVLVCIAVVAAIKNRRGHLRNIETPPQEDINISSTSIGTKMIKGIEEPLYSNSDDPVGDLSIYSLAKDHSEPGDNKDTPDKQYDSVMYKKPRNTDEDKHYDHIMENVYQNPYS